MFFIETTNVIELNQSLFQECFAAFCSGLASNTGLELLDLRNNQLTHQVSHELGQINLAILDKYILQIGQIYLCTFNICSGTNAITKP